MKRTVADFHKAHVRDVPARILKGLAELRAIGSEHYEYELEFMRRCGICPTELGRYRPKFLDYVVKTRGRQPKRVWFGSSQVAARMRALA